MTQPEYRSLHLTRGGIARTPVYPYSNEAALQQPPAGLYAPIKKEIFAEPKESATVLINSSWLKQSPSPNPSNEGKAEEGAVESVAEEVAVEEPVEGVSIDDESKMLIE